MTTTTKSRPSRRPRQLALLLRRVTLISQNRRLTREAAALDASLTAAGYPYGFTPDGARRINRA